MVLIPAPMLINDKLAEIKFIDTICKGLTWTYFGAYAHPYSSVNMSINFGPAGASIDGWGDEWSWEEMFTIGY